MMKKLIFILLSILTVNVMHGKTTCDIRKYMSTQSLKWEQLPMQWNEGAFLGNGRIGMMIYVDSVENSLTLWLSRPDVTDHRKAPNRKSSLGVKGASVMTDYCRMDVGKIRLIPEAKIKSGTMELDIYDATLSGVLHTDKGDIILTAFTPYNNEVNVVEIESNIPYTWKFYPGSPRSPRVQVFPHIKEELKYEDNPAPEQYTARHEGWSVHPLLAGGDYATYWKEVPNSKGSIIYISTMNEVPVSNKSLAKAKNEVNVAIEEGIKNLKREMAAWWHNYYKTGLINIPDKKMENFYHIQLYKLATCSHPDGPVMDNFGTFYKTSQWPGIWWNLNVQLTYMSTHATNRMEQGINYQKLLDSLLLDIMNVIGAEKSGDFAWALHTYYSYMRYAGYSWNDIKDKFIPKAKAIYKIYIPHLKEQDGIIHLMNTESPEYDGFKTYNNSNYNLAALRWLLQTMIELCNRTGEKTDEYTEWKNILERLHPYPVDENGYMIASDQPFAKSHRHYSHLLSFYPLRLQDTTQPGINAVLEKSIDHWMTIGNGGGLAGYSYTGAASLYAYQGNGDKAYTKLHHFLNKPIGMSILLPNTMYVEGGGKNPVIETPLSAATAVTEMLLQGWGETLRIFPAIPDEWKDCSFQKLRAEGGFVVSASRKGGITEWINIHSDAGQKCRIYLPEWKQVNIIKGYKVNIKSEGNGYFTIDLPKGKAITISGQPKTTIQTVYECPKEGSCNFYGVKEGKGLTRQMDWPVSV